MWGRDSILPFILFVLLVLLLVLRIREPALLRMDPIQHGRKGISILHNYTVVGVKARGADTGQRVSDRS